MFSLLLLSSGYGRPDVMAAFDGQIKCSQYLEKKEA
jgi:hypothetical protein